MKRKSISNYVGLVLIVLLIVLLCFMVGWTDSNLDWIVSKISGQPKDVPTWISALVTFIGNGFTLVFNVIIEILKLV